MASPTVISFIVKTGLGSFIFWISILVAFRDTFSAIVSGWISAIPYAGEWGWFREGGAVVVELVVAYTLIIVTIGAVTSLFGERVIVTLAKKKYPDRPIYRGADISTSIYYTLKSTLLFILFFIPSIPLLFVPVLGQVVMLWLWSILIREPMIYEIGPLFIEDRKELKRRAKKARLIALVASTFNYIPILNIVAPLYAQILFMHYLMRDDG